MSLLGAAALPMSPLTESGNMGTAESVLFWIVAPILVLATLGLLFSKRAVHTAVCVVLAMICLATLYIAQDAPFLGVVQIVVYTGAIMMLFVFVLMLVGVDISDSFVEVIRGQRWIAALAGIGLLVVLGAVVLRATYPKSVGMEAVNKTGNTLAVAQIIFSDFPFTLEIVGTLLIIAAVGALVLTHRTRLGRRIGQKERSIMRVKAGTQVTPLPPPGVFAKHNAADVPALDPYGEPIEQSVAQVLRIRGQVRDVRQFEQVDIVREVEGGWPVLEAPDEDRSSVVNSTEDNEGKDQS